jgi:Na+-driven multidrug efflux pump
MERFTMELIAQIVVINVTLIVITAFVARFGIEALAGYGLASRLELLISSSVLAFGLGTTTKVAYVSVQAWSSGRAA